MDKEVKANLVFFSVFLVLLDIHAREPQTSPPAKSTTEKKIVLIRDLVVHVLEDACRDILILLIELID
jgi:hypothetical protein